MLFDQQQNHVALAGEISITTTIQTYPLENANTALADLKGGTSSGTAALVP